MLVARRKLKRFCRNGDCSSVRQKLEISKVIRIIERSPKVFSPLLISAYNVHVFLVPSGANDQKVPRCQFGTKMYSKSVCPYSSEDFISSSSTLVLGCYATNFWYIGIELCCTHTQLSSTVDPSRRVINDGAIRLESDIIATWVIQINRGKNIPGKRNTTSVAALSSPVSF